MIGTENHYQEYPVPLFHAFERKNNNYIHGRKSNATIGYVYRTDGTDRTKIDNRYTDIDFTVPHSTLFSSICSIITSTNDDIVIRIL
jgi:hypothetical protein